jgi:hypothetical protein
MRHFADARDFTKQRSNGLEGEAHSRLEAIEDLRFGFEQSPAAQSSTILFVDNRLRRLGRRVNADEASWVGHQRDEAIGIDSKRALDNDEIERPESGSPAIERPDDHGDARAIVKFTLGRFRCSGVGFQEDNLRAHGGKESRPVAGAARNIEHAIAWNDRRRLEHSRQDDRRQQAAELGATRRQFAIQISERLLFGRNEMLPRHVQERRQHNLIDHPSGAELAVDHVQAPVKHRFGGNVRPLGSDPRCGTDHRPG